MVRVGLAPDNASLLIRFDYHPHLVELTKQLPGRRFHRGMCGWLVPLTKELVQELPGRYPGAELLVEPEVYGRLNDLQQTEDATIKLKEANGNIVLPLDMEFPTTQPMDHQRKALALCSQNPRFGLFMEMGTGKTYVMLALMAWLKRQGMLRPAIIVCPSSVLYVWEDQAKIHQPGLKVRALKGSIKERQRQLQEGWVQGDDIFVTNYEAVWRMEPELAKLPWKMAILDESTRIKSRTTKQTKSVIKMFSQAPRRYILTGTPIPNSPLELFSQFLFLDPAILGKHFYAFRDRYAVMGGYQGYQVVAWRNTTELMQKLAGHSYRVLKKDCLDLPEKVYEPIKLDLDGDQKTAYENLAEQLVAELTETKEVTAAVLVSKLIKLREILAGFVKADDGTLHRFKTNVKLEALAEKLEDLPKDAKIVLWCQFHEEMNLIREMLWERFKIGTEQRVSLDGTVPTQARGPLIHKFHEDPRCRFFIGQQKAGGLGIDLTAAQYCAFMSNDYSPEVRLQAEDRLHRKGQLGTVNYWDFICRKTLDVGILAALRRKQRLSDLLTGSSFLEMISGAEEF